MPGTGRWHGGVGPLRVCLPASASSVYRTSSIARFVNVRVDPNSPVPPSQQLVQAVLDAVASGALGAGDRLPSVRKLAAEALVNPNTVQKAFRDLEHFGVVAGKNGSGVFVTEDGPDTAKGLRLGETLDGFRRAAMQALRAGHERVVLDRLLDELRDGAGDGDVDGDGVEGEHERAARPAGDRT